MAQEASTWSLTRIMHWSKNLRAHLGGSSATSRHHSTKVKSWALRLFGCVVEQQHLSASAAGSIFKKLYILDVSRGARIEIAAAGPDALHRLARTLIAGAAKGNVAAAAMIADRLDGKVSQPRAAVWSLDRTGCTLAWADTWHECCLAQPGQPVFNKSYAERTSQTQQMQVIQSSNQNDFL